MTKRDKKEILGSVIYGITIVLALLSIGWASGAKINNLWSDLIQPLTQGTGQVGTATNPYNSSHQDSVFLADSLAMYKTTGNRRVGIIDTIRSYPSTGAYGTFFYDESTLAWRAIGNLWANTNIYALNGYIGAGTYITIKSVFANISKNNEITATANVDNPYIAFSDSATSAARTRDSLVYNGASFVPTKPLVMTVYAPGTRPTTAELGQIITINGTGDSDSSLQYLGSAWRVIYP